MGKLVLNAGSANNDKTGDTLRAGALKIKANFEEIYAALATDGVNISGGNVLKTGNYQDLSNKPVFATVATTGDFYDLTDRPDIGIFVGVPGNSAGSDGHVAGNLAFDGNNLYVCREDYVETEEFGSFNFLRADGDVAYALQARFANTGAQIAFNKNESVAPIAPEVDWTVTNGTTTRTITSVSEELDGDVIYYLCTLDGAFTSVAGTSYTLSFPLATGQYAFYSTWNAAYQNLIDAHATNLPIRLYVTYDGYGRVVNHVARNSITNEIVITYTAGSEIADYDGITVKIDQPNIWKSVPWAPVFGDGFPGLGGDFYTLQNGTKTLSLASNGTVTVTGNIVPDSNVAYDLGSTTYRFRDLYLSGNTIELGDSTISSTPSGAVSFADGIYLGSLKLSTTDDTTLLVNDEPVGTGTTVASKFVAVNDSGVISGSDDGITWNEYTSSLDSIDRVAVGPNNIVYIANSSSGHGTNESLWYAATYDTAPTEVTSLTSRGFSEVKYFKSISKFIAVGNDGDGETPNPTLHYSDDGITWTASSVDPTYLATIEGYAGGSFSDIAENELGFFVISGNKTIGGFFLTDITDTMNGDNHVDLSTLPDDPDQVVWANSFYFAGWHLITGNDAWTYNSESNPTAGTFNTEFITLDSTWWDNQIGINGGGLVEWVAGEYAGMSVVMSSTTNGQIVYWPAVPAGPYASVPKPYTATITGWTSSATSAITYTEVGGTPGALGEKFTVSGSSVTGYNGTYYLGADGAVFTNNSLTTAFDTTGLDPFTGTATISWSHGQFIDALHYNDGVFYAGNDNEEMFKSTNAGQTWTKVDQLGGGSGESDGYLNDIDSYVDASGQITFNGVQIRGRASEGKYGLIKLVPNTILEGHNFLDNGQFVEIYPTLSFDAPHIHIAAGVGAGSEGDLFLGDDSKHVEVNHDGHVNIRSYYTPTYNQYNWRFNTDGTTHFPYLVTDLHNGGEQSGQTLKFGVAGQQVIITGPTPETNYNAERIIIQGQRAYGTGEGGDVYLWGGDAEHNGGDIKIYAGDANSGVSEGNQGGYINIESGYGHDQGGQLYLQAGNSATYGGNVRILAGTGSTTNGQIELTANDKAWYFKPNGELQLPVGGSIKDSSGNSVLTAVTGQQTYNYDGVNTTLTVTNLNFNLLFCKPASGYVGNAGHTVSLPTAAAGQRLVIINNSTLCTLTITGATADGADILVNPDTNAELIYSTETGVAGWWGLYGTSPSI